jgi:hypothetical protein
MCNTDIRPDAAIATSVAQTRKLRGDFRLFPSLSDDARPTRPATRSFDVSLAGCYGFSTFEVPRTGFGRG